MTDAKEYLRKVKLCDTHINNKIAELERLDGDQRKRRRDEERNACDKNPARNREGAEILCQQDFAA